MTPCSALRLDDELRRDEADVEEQDAREQERRPVEAELAAGLDRLRHPEPGTLGRVQGDEQRAGQRPGGDGDEGPPERQADRHDHAAEHDVEHVDVGARPEGGLVPRFPVPGAGRDHVDVVRLDIPAQLFILHHGLIHDLNYPSEKELLTSSCSTAWTIGSPRPLITALSRSTQDRERSHPDPLSMRPGARIRTAAILERAGVPEVANAGFPPIGIYRQSVRPETRSPAEAKYIGRSRRK